MAKLSNKEKIEFEKFIADFHDLAYRYKQASDGLIIAKKTIEDLQRENERLHSDYDKLQGRYNELVDKVVSSISVTKVE